MPKAKTSSTIIYKVAPRDLWATAEAAGQFAGAPFDLTDGYIHFSAAHQLSETLTKHFAGQADLLLIAVSADSLADRLRWEASRGGDLFPHLYGSLPFDAVVSVHELPLDGEGRHVVPPAVRQ